MASESAPWRSSSATTRPCACWAATESTSRRATTPASPWLSRRPGPRRRPSMYARLPLSELTDRLRTAYEGFGHRDIDAVLSVMDRDIEWDATDALAHTGIYQGHE